MTMEMWWRQGLILKLQTKFRKTKENNLAAYSGNKYLMSCYSRSSQPEKGPAYPS